MKKSDSLLLLGLGVGAVFLLSKRDASGQTPPPELPPPPSPSKTRLEMSVSASPVVGTTPLYVAFNLSVYDFKAPLTRIYWTFGDGDIAKDILFPTHTYTDVGRYPVGVEVTDSEGRDGNTGLNISVFAPTPAVPFTPPAPVGSQVYVTPSYEEIPETAWQPAPEYAEGKIALTTDALAGVSVGGTSADGADMTYYYRDGKLVGVRNQ